MSPDKFDLIKQPKSWPCLAVIGLFAALMIAPIALMGIPDGTDLPQHLRFASIFHQSIAAGDLFPGWGLENNFGFGSVSIRYYPPAAYYLMAFTQLLTGNWYDTFWLNAFFWMFLGGAGVFCWTREWLSPSQALIAALFFCFVPYHVSELYQFLLFAEFAAMGVLPFCFWTATRVIRRGRFSDAAGFAVAYSMLVLTHIPLTIIGSIGLGIYILLLVDRRNFRKTLVNFTAAFGLSLGATAYYWVRLVTEVGWVKHNGPQYYANDIYDYSKYFFPIFYSSDKQIFTKLFGTVDILIVFSILLLLPLVVYALLQFRRTDENAFADQKIISTLSATGLFSIFMMSIPSAFIWNALPILQKIQFPWRWLSLASLVSVVAFVFGVERLAANYQRLQKPLGYAVLALLLAISLFNVTQVVIPAAFVPKDKFLPGLADLDSGQECSCWLTIWARPEAFRNREKVSADGRGVELSSWESERREFTIEAGRPADARVATFYYPHWKATVNDRPVGVRAGDDGAILIPVGEEKSTVRLYFQEPTKLNIALIVSLLTWTFFLAAAAAAVFRKRNFRQPGLMSLD